MQRTWFFHINRPYELRNRVGTWPQKCSLIRRDFRTVCDIRILILLSYVAATWAPVSAPLIMTTSPPPLLQPSRQGQKRTEAFHRSNDISSSNVTSSCCNNSNNSNNSSSSNNNNSSRCNGRTPSQGFRSSPRLPFPRLRPLGLRPSPSPASPRSSPWTSSECRLPSTRTGSCRLHPPRSPRTYQARPACQSPSSKVR